MGRPIRTIKKGDLKNSCVTQIVPHTFSPQKYKTGSDPTSMMSATTRIRSRGLCESSILLGSVPSLFVMSAVYTLPAGGAAFNDIECLGWPMLLVFESVGLLTLFFFLRGEGSPSLNVGQLHRPEVEQDDLLNHLNPSRR